MFSSLTPFVCVFVCVYAYLQVYRNIHGVYVGTYACGGLRLKAKSFSIILSPYAMNQGLSIDPEFMDVASLPSQLALGIL